MVITRNGSEKITVWVMDLLPCIHLYLLHSWSRMVTAIPFWIPTVLSHPVLHVTLVPPLKPCSPPP